MAFHPKPSSLPASPSYPTRPLFPIYPPPPELTTPPPSLPSLARSLSPHSPFAHVSTHIVPAAHIRSTPYVRLPTLPQAEDKDGRKKAALALRDALNKVRDDTASKRPEKGYEWVLWNCVNRYVPKYRAGRVRENGITLLFVHANGFHKETWETTLHNLVTSSYQNIDEIWSFEAVQTGDAALINTGKLGAIYDWTDNARDIANFLAYFLPSAPTSSVHLPAQLPRVPPSESSARMKQGFTHRKVIAVGHSFGGCTSSLAALTYPSLFSSLILIDPVIVKPHYYQAAKDPHIQDLALGAILRRGTWKSREEAKSLMQPNPFFAAWHPDVLQSYIDYGMYQHAPLPPPPQSAASPSVSPQDGSNTLVSLKMPPIQEAIAFLENLTPYEVWQRLVDIDERISMHWIMPQPTGSKFGGAPAAAERVWRRGTNASNVIIHQAGHLIPQEAPKECAEAIVDFLSKKYPAVTEVPQRARL